MAADGSGSDDREKATVEGRGGVGVEWELEWRKYY